MVIIAKVTNTFALSCLLILLSSLIIKPSRAQNSPSLPNLPPPQDVQPSAPLPPPTPLPPQRIPPPSELLKPSQPTTPSEQQIPPIEEIFQVKQIEFIGNTVFSDEKLTELLKEFTNKPINFQQLLEARSKITELYNKEGYITSGAYIPAEQILTDGVVQIQIVEGKLEDIQITGLGKLKPNYIRSRIALGASTPLNQKELLEALQVLQNNPLIEKIETK